MALLNFTGFESGDASEGSASGGTFTINNSVKRTGSYCFQSRPATTAVGWFELARPDLTGFNVTTLYVTFWFRVDTLPGSASEEIILLNNTSSGSKLRVRIDNTGKLSVYNSGNTLVATGTTVLSTATWHKIEITCDTANYTLKINGTTELSGSGSFNATNHGFVRFGKSVNRNGNTVVFYYDDISIDDAAFPTSDLQVKLAAVDSDGSATAWTIGAGSGSDYQVVDDVPHNSNTDYLLSTLVAGDASLVGFASTATAGISGSISALKAHVAIIRDGAANGSVLIRVRSNSTNADSAAVASTSTYLGSGLLRTTDPSSGSSWTSARIDAVEAGVVENSGANKTRCSSIQAHVLYNPTQTVYPSGIGSSASLGAAAVLTIQTTSIGSGASLGSPSVNQIVLMAGIASSAAVGALVVPTIQTPGIGPGAALGSPTITLYIAPPGIGSTVALGAHTVKYTINVFPGIGTVQTAPRIVSGASAAPSSPPAPIYAFGGPYTNNYNVMLARFYSALYFWQNLVWVLRMFPSVVARWLTELPPECGYRNNPLLIIDYGDPVSDIVDPIVVFSTYDSSISVGLSGEPSGSVSGIQLSEPIADPPSSPPNPPAPDPLPAVSAPFSLPKRGHKRLDLLFVQDDDLSTVQALFSFAITDGALNPSFVLLALAQRAVAIQFREDWERGNRPNISFVSKTDIFSSDYVREQRTNTLQPADDANGLRAESAHVITATFKSDGRDEASIIWNRFERAKHRRVAVPWYSEPLIAAVNLVGLTAFSPVGFPLSSLIWNGYGDGAEVIRLHRRRRGVFEVRKVLFNLGSNVLTANKPWLLDIPAAEQVLYVVRYCSIASVDRSNNSDTHQTFKVVFASAD